MVHRFNARSASRVFLLPVVPVVLVGGSVALFLAGQPLFGVIALAVSAWVSYYFLRYTIYQFRSNVETSEDGLQCRTSMGLETGMQWSAITHAGSFATKRAGTYLFVYNETDDELLSVPPYYTDVGGLEARIS